MEKNTKTLNFKLRKKIYNRDGKTCNLCSMPLVLFRSQITYLGKYSLASIDHILPRVNGGDNSETNLQLLCCKCNSSKGAK